MNKRRIIHYLVLCLAVWLPLDNAVAGAVIEGCPMMSHAFEQGLGAMHEAAPLPCHSAPLPDTKKTDQSVASSDHEGHSGCHCSICLLFGAVSLPSQIHALPLHLSDNRDASGYLGTAPRGNLASPFRPPIV